MGALLPVVAETAVEYTHTSASQVQLFKDCPRKWFNRHILKDKEPTKPFQEVGTVIHADGEHWANTGEVRGDRFPAALEFLPAWNPEILIAERKIEMPTYEGGPVWIGYVDLGIIAGPKQITVMDYKTTSDFRYAKTPAELADNIQMVSYAWEAFLGHPEIDDLQLSHLYIRTRGKPKAMLVSVVVRREEIAEKWEKILDIQREMCDWARKAPKTADDLPPNINSCSAYGGCYYRSKCGLDPNQGRYFKMVSGGGSGKVSPLTQRLLEAKARALGQPPPVTTIAESAPEAGSDFFDPDKRREAPEASGSDALPIVAPPVLGIVPPDAPPRTTPLASLPPAPGTEAETLPSEPRKRRGRPPKVSVTVEGVEVDPAGGPVLAPPPAAPAAVAPPTALFPVEKPQAASPAPAAPAPAPTAPVAAKVPAVKPIIYVDCYPTKAAGEAPPVALEDWILPLATKAAQAVGVADYRLIDGYGKAEAVLGVFIRESLDTLPPVLVMSASSFYYRGAYDVIAPFAARIVKATRG